MSFNFGGTGDKKPSPFSFGNTTPAANNTNNLFGNAASTTPAGNPPASTGFSFGATSNPFGKTENASNTQNTTGTSNAPSFSFGGTPQATNLGTSGFGAASTPATPATQADNFNKPAETENKGFSFNTAAASTPAAETPKAGGFSFGKPEEKTASGGFSFGKPEDKPAAGLSFGKPEEKPAAGLNFGKTEDKPSTSFSFGKQEDKLPPSTGISLNKPEDKPADKGFSFGKTEDKPADKGFSFGKTEDKPAEKGFSFGKPAETAKPDEKKDETNKTEEKKEGGFSFGKTEEKKDAKATPAAAPPSLQNRTMEDIIKKWSGDLDKYSKEFQAQARQISTWDQTLLTSGDQISRLYAATVEAEQSSGKVDQALNYIENQQDELSQLLDTYESQVRDITMQANLTQPADQEREKAYTQAETLINDLESVGKNIADLTNELNDSTAALARLKDEDPVELDRQDSQYTSPDIILDR
ncbi:hypothetical protein MRB53_039213 [Persea americana]|nr:hypothetical protein MRB53_039213 [Persea americana]